MDGANRDIAMADVVESSEQSVELVAMQPSTSSAPPADEGAALTVEQSEKATTPPTPQPSSTPGGQIADQTSNSSPESLVAASQSAGLSPYRTAQQGHLYPGSMPESPDPLLISPVASAASSAGGARAQADARARSASSEPGRGYLRSSPSRIAARQRSKTPTAKDVFGENADPASDEVLAAIPPSGQRRLSRPPEPADAGSDDELAMSPLRAAPPRAKAQLRGDFMGVEIPPARRPRPTRSSSDTTSPQGLQSQSPQLSDQSSSNMPQAGSSSRRTASFELIVDKPRSASRSPRTSPRASPAVRDDEAAIIRDFAAQHLSTSSSHPLSRVDHPLSQVHSRESLAADSSPLTSIPATSPIRQHTPEPIVSPSKRRRRKAKDATYTADAESEDEGADTSSTLSNPSPKKKRKPRASAAAKTAKATGRRRTPTGRNRKDDQAEPDEGSSSPTQSTGVSTNLDHDTSNRPRRDRKGKAKAAELEAEDTLSAVREAAAAANRNTRRQSTTKKSYKEADFDDSDAEEAEEGAAAGSEPQETSPRKKRGRPRKVVDSDSTPRALTGVKSKARGRASRASESGCRVEQPASGADAPTPVSSPSKRNGLSAPEMFGSQSSAQGRASRQTAEQRKAGWSKYAFSAGQPLWVHVCKAGESGFWWPGEITSGLVERPLKVKLYLDASGMITTFSEESLSIEEPDHEVLATFRNPAKLRFDKHIFRDEDEAAPGSAPSDEAFAEVLEKAIEREAEADGDDDDEDQDISAPSTASGPASTAAPKAKRRGKAPVKNSSEKELEARPVPARSDDSDFDEILDVDDGDTSFELPFICLAKATNTWWPARCIAQVPASPSKKGRGAKCKFKVEYTDGSIATVAPKSILTPKQKNFFEVKLGDTELELDASYVARTKSFVTIDMLPVYQEIINEEYGYARDRNEDFYAGGHRRERLAQRSVFGELPDDVVEMVLEVISEWADGVGSADGRPQGSDRYNALSPVERVQYRADVLLPLAIIENYADDGALPDKADELLRQAGVAEPTEEECKLKALAMAEADLDRRSVTKAVLAMRNARKKVRGGRRSRA